MREQSFAASGTVELEVRSTSGDVSIDAVDGLDRVTVVLKSPKGDHELEDATLLESAEHEGRQRVTVQVPKRRIFGVFDMGTGPLEVKVTCPSGTEPTVDVVSSDIRASGRFGKTALHTVNGDIKVDTVTGDAMLKTVSGDIEAGEVSGAATLQTVSGDMTLDHVMGDARFRSISGDMRLGILDSTVSVSSISGDIELESVAQGSVDLKTSSGDMRIGVRKGVRVWIDARSLSGRTTSDLPLSDEEPAGSGSLLELRATATSGDIRVVRAAS